MNAPTVIPQEGAQLALDLKKSWDNLAGIIRRRCPADADRIIGKSKDGLFRALVGTSKAKLLASGSSLTLSEMKRLLSVYEELIAVIKGGDGDPGLESGLIENEIGIRLAVLAQERNASRFGSRTPGSTDDRATRHHLPPIGTLVWYDDIVLEVVPAARITRHQSGAGRPYRPRGGRALLCLKGERTGAYNVAPSALAMAIGRKNQNGWHVMEYSPTRLGHGAISEAADKLLASRKVYPCEIPKGGSAPAPVPELEALTAASVPFRRIGDEVPLITFDLTAGASQTPTPASSPATPSPAPAPTPTPVSPPPLILTCEAIVARMIRLRDAVNEANRLIPAVERFKELQPSVDEYNKLRDQFHGVMVAEMTRLLGEHNNRRISFKDMVASMALLKAQEEQL